MYTFLIIGDLLKLFVFILFLEGGHDSSEDARACIGLVKHYLRNRIV